MPDMMAPPAPPPGTTGPSTMPVKNAGMDSKADVIMAGVATVITKALPMLDPMSDKAKAARKALEAITKAFGPASPALGQAQVKSFAAGVQPTQGPPQAAAAEKLGSMGLQPQPPQGA